MPILYFKKLCQIGVTSRSIERHIKNPQAVARIKRIGGDHSGQWKVIEHE